MLTLAEIFTSNMILQRRKPIPVWGTGQPGHIVTVKLGDTVQSATVEADGSWMIVLPPREAGSELTLLAQCDGWVLPCSNVQMGEVWLAGGQSNMEMPLAESQNGKRAVAESGTSNVRFYTVPRRAIPDAGCAENRWLICSPETSGNLSAVAYYFARQIASTQKVPVGIIDCCWGGTSISCWMSREQLEKTKSGQRYLDDYAALVGDKTDEAYAKEMAAYNAEYEAWNKRVESYHTAYPKATWETINRECGPCPWPQPAGNQSPFRPAGLYETMLHPLAPFGLRGFLYYQGEEDADRYFRTYGEMMEQLIDQWRTDWNELELPFLFVQLPMYTAQEDYKNHLDNRHWAYLRDEQMKVSKCVANTGLAVLTDCGEFDNIHPLDKQTVGNRLALLARAKVYGEAIPAMAPAMKTVIKTGSTMEVLFQHTAGALSVHGDSLDGFELAGKDGIYYPARAEVQLDTVAVSADEVSQPETVRYAWFNYGTANLYSAAGLAAAPFRTDQQKIQ